MIPNNIMSKINEVLPNGERAVQVLKFLPTTEYEFSNEIYLIRTINERYILKLLVGEHLNNKEVKINNIISKHTSCKVPRIIAYEQEWILMEYIDGFELSKLFEYGIITLQELEDVAKKLGVYIGEIISECKLTEDDIEVYEKYNAEGVISNEVSSLLPFNVEIMMKREDNEWKITGMIDLELMEFGNVNEYTNYIVSSQVIMLPGLKQRPIDIDNRLNRTYVEALMTRILKK